MLPVEDADPGYAKAHEDNDHDEKSKIGTQTASIVRCFRRPVEVRPKSC